MTDIDPGLFNSSAVEENGKSLPDPVTDAFCQDSVFTDGNAAHIGSADQRIVIHGLIFLLLRSQCWS